MKMCPKAPPIIYSGRHFRILLLFVKKNKKQIRHDISRESDDSHEKLCLIIFRKLGKMSQSLSSAVVVILALRFTFSIALYSKIGPEVKKIDHARNVSNANNRYTLWAWSIQLMRA